MSKPVYSVVVPVYRSAQTLQELHRRISETMLKHSLEYEIIFVDDCGGGGTWPILESLSQTNPNTISIRLSRNYGQHNATFCGMVNSKGDFIITIDDDPQIPPEEIIKLVNRQKETGAELVYANYGEKKHNAFRNLGSWAITSLIKWSFNTQITATSFRLISKSVIGSLVNIKQSYVYLDGIFLWHTSNIESVLVEHRNREVGKSNYTIKKLLLLSSNMLLNFTTIPLRGIIYLGFTIAFLSFLLGAYFVVKKIFSNVPIGYTSLVVSIYFMGGVTLIVLGIIGEYLGRLYSTQIGKPQFNIQSKIDGNKI